MPLDVTKRKTASKAVPLQVALSRRSAPSLDDRSLALANRSLALADAASEAKGKKN